MIRFIIAALCVGIAGAAFFLYTKPAYDSAREIQKTIAEYDLALDKANELQKLRQSLLARYNTFDPTKVDRLHKLLPDHVDNVRLVLDLDTLASRSGLSLQNIVVNAPAESKSTAAGSPIGGSALPYESLTFKFSTQGTYAGFRKFMEDIEHSLRIVDVVSLAINAAGGEAGAEPVYRYEVVIRTYWLK